jgi:hypothetical protein
MWTADANELNEDERALVQTWVHRGHAAARLHRRARILVKLAEADGWRDLEIARALEVGWVRSTTRGSAS